MSCSEVVYQAYYPYLYQRPSTSAASAAAQSRAAAAAHFPAFPHNYDRFNVAAYGGSSSLVGGGSGGGGGAGGGGGGHSSGSVSSGGGAGSPGSPGLHHKDEESTPPETTGDEEALSPGDAVGSRAQYVSANCVVFTHYTGDVASVVDEHFTRALSYKTPSSPNSAKESSPMTSRNFPPSFWNSNYQSTNQSSAADLYGDSVYHNVAGASTDPWHHPHYQYSHHRAVHEYHHHHHHHNMAAQYGSLLLGHPPPARLGHPGHHATGPYHHHAATKPPEWPPNHTPRGQPHAHHLDPTTTPTYPAAAYPSMSGLEAQVQADSKDLYWF